MKERTELAERLGDKETRERMKDVVKPNSVSNVMRKAGVAMILAPDPVTAVPGALMLGASLATKRRDPMSPVSVYDEARRLIDEIGSSI